MYFHSFAEYVELGENSRAQTALIPPSSLFEGYSSANTASSNNPGISGFKKSTFLCRNKYGWGPLTEDYSFTPCFLDGVFLNIANLLIFTLGTYQLIVLWKRKPLPAKATWGLALKLALVGLQLGFFITLAIIAGKNSDSAFADISVLSPLITSLGLIIAFGIHCIEHTRSLISNGVLLFYWLFSPIFLGLKVNGLRSLGAFKDHRVYSSLYALAAINSLIVLLLEWLLPKSLSPYHALMEQADRNPVEKADIFSRLTFSWMGGLMRRGYETYLTEEDLPELPSKDTTSKIGSTFESFWDRQVNTKKTPSIAIALSQAFGLPFLVGAFFKALQDVLAFAQPQLLRLLIKFVNEYQQTDGEVSLSKGMLIALAMFIVSVTQTAFLHQYFQRAFETGMRFKASLTSAIYKKAMVLSNEDRAAKTTGDIVNLMSVDTQRIQDLSQYGQIIWSGPFQIILCLASLYNLLGNSMWAGVVVMLVMILINGVVARSIKNLQQQQMKNKDERTKLTSELLTNMKSLKLYAWEPPFVSRLNHVRNNLELKTLRDIGIYAGTTSFLWNCAPFLVSCCTFAIFVYTKNEPLTTDIVFPALTLFNLLSFPLSVIPMVVTSLIEAAVAVGRLQKFLLSEELQPDAVERLPRANNIGEESVVIENGTFLWERKPEYNVSLGNINFTARKGELSCIVGRVGSGKSSLLSTVLGDLHKAQGNVTVKGKVAYSSQVPWIMNASVKENILFGNKDDPEFYQRTIHACALIDDLAILPDGDETMVGEKGISLSGGQKARIGLARAVYARADVYLLDDVLSAVDEHVGRHIINNVICENGLLASKTIVLATNSITVLSHAHTITMLSDGKIVEAGTYSEAIEKKGSIFNLLRDFGRKRESNHGNGESDSGSETALESQNDGTSSSAVSDHDEETPVRYTSEESTDLRKRRESSNTLRRASTASYTKVKVADDEERQKNEQQKEHSEKGKVKWSVYTEYAKASNIWAVLAYLFFLIGSMALSVGGNVWLKYWSEVNTKAKDNPHIAWYLGVYAVFGIGSSLLVLVETLIIMIYCAIHGAKILHNRMLNSVVSAPMSFFETTPIGRILNRFSNDIYRVDQVLTRTFHQFFSNAIKVLFTLGVISFSTPQFLLFVIPLSGLYLYYQRYYLRTSRELKRLDSVSKSPIYAHFQETLDGISTIRAYAQQKRFTFTNESRVDLNMQAYFPTVSANRWLAVRLEFIGAIIIFAAASLAIITLPSGRLTAGVVGLALSYALQITQSLNWIVRMTVEVETNIVSVERVLEYSELPSEAPAVIENSRPPAAWPTSGDIKFENYSTRYRPELSLVLKNINLDIKGKEKIGIVGRTGAGKSSLTLALFRIIEAAEGHISVDKINTDSIGLRDLRRHLSIIPQDSQAFEGTIRDNLDPEHTRDDTELWRILELSHLKPFVENMQGGLDGKVNEGGSNLSVGQRQLVCLARALLAPSKVLVLDEATAAVDVETDKVLQETIRTEFKDRTILTIAHRLNTIMDSDRIIVLDQGKVSEFDTPQNLLQNSESLFYGLCKQGGILDESGQKAD